MKQFIITLFAIMFFANFANAECQPSVDSTDIIKQTVQYNVNRSDKPVPNMVLARQLAELQLRVSAAHIHDIRLLWTAYSEPVGSDVGYAYFFYVVNYTQTVFSKKVDFLFLSQQSEMSEYAATDSLINNLEENEKFFDYEMVSAVPVAYLHPNYITKYTYIVYYTCLLY